LAKFIKPFRISLPWRRKPKPGQDSVAGNYPEDSVISNQELQSISLSTDLQDNLRQIKTILSECSDMIYREFDFAQDGRIKLAIVYLDGMTDKIQISAQVMRSLMLDAPLVERGKEFTRTQAFALIKKKLLPIQQVEEANNMGQVIDAVLSGDTVLFVDGHASAIISATKGWEGRGVEESQTELVVRGPREAFVETIRVNISLIRRKIKNPNLKIEAMKLGQATKTDV